jgi:nucleotide-binding universal stress UspA family protein
VRASNVSFAGPLCAERSVSIPDGRSAMFRTILVPLNGTTTAEIAVPYAIDQARRHDAQLVLLRVVPRPELPRNLVARGGPMPVAYACADMELECLYSQARRYLLSLVERYRLGSDTVISIAIGDPYLRLKAAIAQYVAPLVVVASTEPNSTYPSALTDSVARTIRDGEVPILVVRNPLPEPVARGAVDLPVTVFDSPMPVDVQPQWHVLTAVDARVAGVN